MTLETPSTTAARVLDCFDEPAMLLDEKGTIRAANRSALALSADGRTVVGRRCHEVSFGWALPCASSARLCPLKLALRDGKPSRTFASSANAEAREIFVHPVGADDRGQRLFVEVLRPGNVRSAAPATGGRLVGRSPAFTKMMELVARAAPTETSVLLQGSSGTGKELVAEAIHRGSRRSAAAFVPLDCSGLPATLFESELFGHEKGAFTGATGLKRGLVEAARGGTLFLDEVGDIPLELQVKLLRLLESGAFRRVGGTELRHSDFRLVCATHRDLEAMVEAGAFREDLFYRVSAFPIRLPPLSERREDIPLLVDAGLRRLGCAESNRLSRDAMDVLVNYDFPGNVRELLNIVERAAILADGETIEPHHLARIAVRSVGAPERPAAREAARRSERTLPGNGRPRPLRLDRLVTRGVRPIPAGAKKASVPAVDHASAPSVASASRSLR